MHVGLAYYGSYPVPHLRDIALWGEQLGRLGHQVTVITRTTGLAEREVVVRGVRVIALTDSGAGLWQRTAAVPAPANMLWRRAIERTCRRLDIDALVARETPLASAVLAVAGRLGIPAYLDMRESLPLLYRLAPGRIPNPLKSPPLVAAYERRVVPRFDGVFFVSPELQDWAVDAYRIDPAVARVVPNVVSDDYVELAGGVAVRPTRQNGRFRIGFCGFVTRDRGLGAVLRAVEILRDGDEPVEMRIIGSGDHLDQLRADARSIGVDGVVEFLPLLPIEQLPEALAQCDVGLCADWLTDMGHLTVPGKLFEYMGVGLPVVASRRRPVVRILAETQAGLTFADHSPLTIARTLRALHRDPGRRREMGRRGRLAVETRYSTAAVRRPLAEVFGGAVEPSDARAGAGTG